MEKHEKKKKLCIVKRIMAVVLAVCVMVGVMPPIAKPLEVKASTNGHTREEAVQWAKNQVNQDTDMDGYYGAQCVDLIVAYYEYLGKPFPYDSHAKDFLEDGNNRRPGEWPRYTNGQTTPQPGDIVIFGEGKFGHIGIVVDANEQSYYYIDFNACGDNKGYGPPGTEAYDSRYPKWKDKYTCPQVTCSTGLGGYGQIRNKPLNVFSGLIRPDWPYSPPQGTPLPEDPSNRVVSDGDYHIVTAVTGDRFLPGPLCMTTGGLPDTLNQNDAYMEIWKYLEHADIRQAVFTVTWLGNGFYKIKLKDSNNMCLDVPGGGMDRGLEIRQHEDNGTPAQQWRINETGDGIGYTIRSRLNSWYLDVKDGRRAEQTRIQLWEENGNIAQRWYFIPWGGGDTSQQEIPDGEYQIVSKLASDKALNAEGDSVTDGANINLRSCIGDAKQTFNVKWLGNGYYSIAHSNSGLVLDVYDALSKNETNVQLKELINGYVNKRWLIKSCGDGYYNIISQCNGLYLDAARNTPNVHLWYGHGGDNQKWKFVPFSRAVEVSSVTLDKTTLTLTNGASSTLTATVSPADAADKTLTWTSSNTSVAAVDNSGRVTAKAAGTSTITAKSANGKSASCQVTVTHTHTYASAWQSDSSNHWKECSCGAKSEEAAHDFEWIVDRPATTENTGLKHEECATCHYRRSEGTAIEKLQPVPTHEYGAWQSDSSNHWRECSCGERTRESSHNFAWVVDTAATADSEGSKHEECEICGYKQNENTPIGMLPEGHDEHTFDSAWKSNSDGHWKVCACGAEDAASGHTFEWFTDREATAEREGSKHEECTVCGYVQSEGTVIPKTEHTHTYGDGWMSDSDSHWKECGCRDKANVNAHTFAWIIDRAATTDSTGLKHEQCATCGYRRNEGTVIDKLSDNTEDTPPAASDDNTNPGSSNPGNNADNASSSSSASSSSASSSSSAAASYSAPAPSKANGPIIGQSKGWSALEKEVDGAMAKARNGAEAVVAVILNGAEIIPESALNVVAGKNVTLCLVTNTGAAVNMNGNALNPGAVGSVGISSEKDKDGNDIIKIRNTSNDINKSIAVFVQSKMAKTLYFIDAANALIPFRTGNAAETGYVGFEVPFVNADYIVK